MPRAARSCGGSDVISSPSRVIFPRRVIRSPPRISSFFRMSRRMPESMYISVLFPALLEPKTPITEPSSALRPTLFSASMFS